MLQEFFNSPKPTNKQKNEKKPKPKPPTSKIHKTKLCIFWLRSSCILPDCGKEHVKERAPWIGRKAFPSVATVSRSFCHPLLTAVGWFPGGRWSGRSEGDCGSPQAPPSAAHALDPVMRGMLHCWATSLSLPCTVTAADIPSVGRHCRFRHTASEEVSTGKVSSAATQTTNFLWSSGLLNKSGEGEEFHGSGQALMFPKWPWVNNMPRARCQYWYSFF